MRELLIFNKIRSKIDKILPHLDDGAILPILRENLLGDVPVEFVATLLANFLDLQLIGSGCSRGTFKLSDRAVLKMSLGNDDDMGQHLNEIACLLYAMDHNISNIPKLIYADYNYIVVENIPQQVLQNEMKNTKAIIKTLENSGFIMQHGDIGNVSNWRKTTEDQLYLIDLGTVELQEDIVEEYFNKARDYMKSCTNQIIGF